jgi:hypothetical protein
VTIVQRFIVWRNAVEYDVSFIICIDEKGRIDTIGLFKPDRVTPGAFRVFSCDDKISSLINQCANDIIGSVMVGNRWREQTTGYTCISKIQLFFSIHGISELLPVYKICAMEYWQTREIGKGRIDNVVVVSYSDDTGIRVESGENGVVVSKGCLSVGNYGY